MSQRSRVSILLLAAFLALGCLAPGVGSAGTYATCTSCHALPLEQAMGYLGPHGSPSAQPEYACFNCHSYAPHDGPSSPPGYWNWPLNPAPSSYTTQMCSAPTCHDTQSEPQWHEQIHSFDKIPMPPVKISNGSPIIDPTSVLPLRNWYGQLLRDRYEGGGLVCSTCHNPHDPSYDLPREMGGFYPSFLRIGDSYFGKDPLCGSCHTDVAPTFGDDLIIDNTSDSVRIIPAQSGPYDLEFTVRNRGNGSSFYGSYVFVEAEDRYGWRTPVGDVWLPGLFPDQSFTAVTAWDPGVIDGPVTFLFTLPPSMLRPDQYQRVIVRSFTSPAAPVALNANPTSWDAVGLSWYYPPTPGVTFNVFRDGVKVNDLPIPSTNFWDVGLAPETPHTYTVQAVAADGGIPSAMSNRAGAQTLAGFIVRVPEDYPTIQAAINASFPGTSIHVAAGTYTESLFFYGKNQVTVKGVDANGCIIEAVEPKVVDLFSGNPNGPSNNTFAGFTLRNTTLDLQKGSVAYGCVITADQNQPQTVVYGSGLIASSVLDTAANAISVQPMDNLTVANCILLGFEPITQIYPSDPPTTVLLLNNLFQSYGIWQEFPGEQNVVGDPLFCGGSYFIAANSICRDRGTYLNMMTPGPPDIGAFEYGQVYTSQPPTGLSGTRLPGAYLMTDIHLSWAPSSDEACNPPAEYQVYRSATPDFPPASLSTPIASVPGFAASFVDIAVPPWQVFYYQVRASGFGFPGPLVSAPSNTAFVAAMPNSPPVAVDDVASTPEELPVPVFVQSNDSDPDGDPTFIVGNTTPSYGSVVFDGNYAFTYTPNRDFNGVDSFSYTITDAWGATDSATVTITVTPVNDNPVANADSATTDEDVAVTISVLANDTDIDGDTLSISGVTNGTLGAVAIVGSSVRYTPAENLSGSDSFTYTVGDGNGGSATATVNVIVTPDNDYPVALDGSVATGESTAVGITLTAADLDGDPLSYTVVTAPAYGTLAGTAPNLVYTPSTGYFGTDFFTFVANDGAFNSNVARVSLTITPGLRRVIASAEAGGSIAPSGTEMVPYGTIKIFTVTSNAGYHIAAVTGCGGTLNDATYTTSPITEDCAVAASFAIDSYTLTVAKAGTGSGTVTSTPADINCGSICSADYDYGSSVTLTATPAANSFFAGWSGGVCSGTGACSITMNAARTVTATFTQGLTVTVPNGGESWRKGSTQTIRWAYAGTPGSWVKIELLKGGTVNKTITSSTSSGSNGAGSYSWKIPSNQTLGSNYMIRITSTSQSSYIDSSNANFTITK